MTALQHSYVATAFLSAGTIARGQCAVLNAAGTGYVVATTAALAAADRHASGIALTAATGTPGDNAFQIQFVGDVPEAITDLGDGDATFVRVSSTGVLERVDTYDPGDEICGHCDEDGVAHVNFALIGMSLALGSGSGPAGNAQAIQYKVDSSTFGGAALASINEDFGTLQIGASEAGGVPDIGYMNVCRGFTLYGKSASTNPTGYYLLLRHRSNLVNCRDLVFLGDGATDGFAINALRYAGIEAGLAGGSGFDSGVIVLANDAVNSGTTSKGVFVHGNFGFGKIDDIGDTGDPIWRSAKGLINVRPYTTGPSTGPTASFDLRAHPSTYVPQYLLPGDDATSGWRDFGGDSESELVNVTSTTPGDVAITAGIVNATVNCNASGAMTITGFTAPAAGEPRTIHLTNNSTDNVTITANAGGTAANGIAVSGANDTLTVPQNAAVTLSYDHNADRFIVHLGAELSNV